MIQLATFTLAFLVLKRYAFKPILRAMQERRATIESGVKLGEEMKAERAKLEAEADKTLQAARQQADGIIADTHETARQMMSEAEEQAREKANGIIAAADDRIAQDAARARKALESELVGLVSEATEAIIKEKVDAKKDAKLIEGALKERQTT